MLHNSQKTAMVRCLKGLGDYKPFFNINDSSCTLYWRTP